MSPTQRTLRHLRGQGMVCGIVERWIPRANVRHDFLGIIDIIALDPEIGVVGIQSCGTAFSAHLRKLTLDRAQELSEWLSTPGTAMYLYGWRKVSVKRGGKAKVWAPRIQEITLEDLSR